MPTLDPKVKEWLDVMTSLMPPIGSMPAAEMRALMAQAPVQQGPEVHRVENGTLPGPGGAIPYRLYRPTPKPEAFIVYYHGGGWTLGTLDGYDVALRKLALKANAAIISIDYRLAPEHPFPAAVDDALAAFRWSAERIEQLAGAAVPIFVAGDSAGGNLSAVVAQVMRDEKGPKIDGQILIYPATEGNVDAPVMTEFVAPFLKREEIVWFYDQYTPDKSVRTNPRLAPLLASNFRKLPPAFVLTAENDLLYAEGEAYADKLDNGGAPTRVKRYMGTFHGFLTLDNGLPHSAEATQDIADFIRETIEASP